VFSLIVTSIFDANDWSATYALKKTLKNSSKTFGSLFLKPSELLNYSINSESSFVRFFLRAGNILNATSADAAVLNNTSEFNLLGYLIP
jgi:hypothetical protein